MLNCYTRSSTVFDNSEVLDTSFLSLPQECSTMQMWGDTGWYNYNFLKKSDGKEIMHVFSKGVKSMEGLGI